MKKLNYFLVVALLIASAFAISCTKDSFPDGPVNPGSGDPLPGAEIGSIVDLGLVNSNTRVMSATFMTNSLALDGYEVDLMGSAAMVTIFYYVDKDAHIPEGEYSFSTTDTKSPFTFDSALLHSAVDANGNQIPQASIVGGSVVVTREGPEYVFQLQGQLDSGQLISGLAKGELTYNDDHIFPYSEEN
jgi:hypothetical protein